jgi:hypothetical protein
MSRAFALLLAIVALGWGSPGTRADEPGLPDRLIGTWRLVSAKYGGQEVTFPEGITTLKHITPSQFHWLSHGPDGVVTRAAGGPYTLRDDRYEETPEYGVGDDFNTVKGQTHTFTCRIDGNKWHHTGELKSGLTIEEVWERVEPKK